MVEEWIVAFDVVSTISFALAIIISTRIKRTVLGRSTLLFLQGALLVYVFVGISNILEHAGITDYLDLYEDFAEMLFAPFFLFFLYAAMLRREVGLRLTTEAELERTVQESELRFQSLIERLPAIAFIKNEKLEIIYRNRQFIQAFGEIDDPDHRVVEWPAEVETRLRAHDRIAMAQGHWSGQEQVEDRSGTMRTYHVSKFKVETIDKSNLLIGFAVDMTEREQLAEQRHLLGSIVEQAGEAILVTDRIGRIEYVNHAFEELTGYMRDEVIGKTPAILKSGKHDDNYYGELWQTIQNGNIWRGDFVNQRKDGTLYYENATIFPVFDQTGEISQFAAVKRDVTREHELEDMLRQSQKLESIGRLAGGVAHDFNNLLTAINGYSGMAIKLLEPGTRQHKYLQHILSSGNRAADLTQKLLALGRKQPIHPVVLSLNDKIRDFEKIAKPLIGEDIALKVHLNEDVPSILADGSQIDQILMNLVVNARDAIKSFPECASREIVVKTGVSFLDDSYVRRHVDASTGKFVTLTIMDKGAGIPKAIRDRMFEPFFTTKEPGVGTGLGLSTVYGIVKQNGGSIYVYSEEGKGALFRINWPAYTHGDLKEEAAETQNHIEEIVHGEGSVMVVEDEDDVRNICCQILREAGYAVMEADSAEIALELLMNYKGKLDVLFSDIVLPGISGLDLADQVREMRPNTRILFTSGYSDELLDSERISSRNGHLVQKPYTAETITRIISELMNE